MKKSLLFLAVCGLDMAGPVWGMDIEASSSVQKNKLYEIRHQEGSRINRADRLVKKLAESVGRVSLGAAAIAGTTLIGVGFVEALLRAKAQSDLWDSVNKQGIWKESRSFSLLSKQFSIGYREKMVPGFGQVFLDKIGYGDNALLKKVSSYSANTIFSNSYFYPAVFGLLKGGASFVIKGYKFGGNQIYKGVWGIWTSDNLVKAN